MTVKEVLIRVEYHGQVWYVVKALEETNGKMQINRGRNPRNDELSHKQA